MRQLNSNLLPLTMRKVHDRLQRRDLAIFPQPRIFRRDSAFGCHGCGFNDGETWAALDDAAEVCEVPCCVVSILGGVLTHWGDYDAVLEGETAEFERLEELRDGRGPGGVDDCCAGWY